VKAVDVLSEMEDGSIKSIGGGREYYLLMERAAGENYFDDLKLFAGKKQLHLSDSKKIRSMASYLAGIHSVKKDSPALYRRKLRDTVGHGECLMGVFDTYPDGVISADEMAYIVKKSIDWIIKLKPKHKRLAQVHGDFHPGNIWFTPETNLSEHEEAGDADFILLDRSRGPWGEPADDVTALTINYIFFSVINHGDVRGAYQEGLRLFYDAYIRDSLDEEITSVAAPFYAFRGAVVANPVFYPQVTTEQRNRIFRFVMNVLDDAAFNVEKVNDYLR
jgi:aminoglycoside phosphotransferase (APT) family kinase protein